MDAQSLTRGKRILVVDDTEAILDVASMPLLQEGCEVVTATSGDQGVTLAEEQAFHVILTDMEMPGLSWEPLVRRFRSIQPTTPVIVMTAHWQVERFLDMLRSGDAQDIVTKPFNGNQIKISVVRALELEALRQENRTLRSKVPESEPVVVRGDERTARLLDEVATVAATDFPVLLTGESGTGKEIVARYIHWRSPRARGPFIAVNCAAVPTELFESEFFGHARGAFTGAHAERKGLFEAAGGGTIFLDEIGEVELENQVKLLRVLQESEVRRIGEQKVRTIDARVLCATNRDLKAAVRQGLFREDLYYRINVFPVIVPPLRERPGDIVPLAHYFLVRSRAELGRDVTEISRAAIDRLRAYAWPGNVRQLENVLKQAMIRCAGARIEADDLFLDEDEAEMTLGPAVPADTRPSRGEPDAAGLGPSGTGGMAGIAEAAREGEGLASDGTVPVSPASDPRVGTPGWTEGLTLRVARDRFLRHYLEDLLARVGGNVSRAAELAGKHRSDFYELVGRCDIDLSRFRSGGAREGEGGSES